MKACPQTHRGARGGNSRRGAQAAPRRAAPGPVPGAISPPEAQWQAGTQIKDSEEGAAGGAGRLERLGSRGATGQSV